MPTKSDFEAAAAKFTAAAQQVGDLTAAAEGAGASDILSGGSLGQQVPDRIASAASTAQSCRGMIEAAAATCRERAEIIAEYEERLAEYDRAYEGYRQASYWWSVQYSAWSVDETGRVYHPGPHPSPPPKPTPPPSWADVRIP